MTTWEIEVPLVLDGTGRRLPKRPLTTNVRLHWRRRAECVKTIREIVAVRARSVVRIPPQEHITVQLRFSPGDKRRRDAPNLTATQKPAVDGLVDAGIVPDDTARYVTELMPVLVPSAPRERRLWLVVQSDEDGQS